MNFFRCQHKGYTLEQMQQFVSADGGDVDDDAELEGICVSDSPRPSTFGGAWDAMDDDDDVVVLKGIVVSEIYDGYRINPTAEVARFTVAEWRAMVADGSAQDYEDWS